MAPPSISLSLSLCLRERLTIYSIIDQISKSRLHAAEIDERDLCAARADRLYGVVALFTGSPCFFFFRVYIAASDRGESSGCTSLGKKGAIYAREALSLSLRVSPSRPGESSLFTSRSILSMPLAPTDQPSSSSSSS